MNKETKEEESCDPIEISILKVLFLLSGSSFY